MRRFMLAFAACLAFSPALAADADKTLPPPQYAAKGLPALDKPWGEPEYSTASNVIGALTIDQLPRLSSARSAPVILKMSDASGLAYCKNKKGDLGARIGTCAKQLNAVLAIFNRYATDAAKQPALNDTTMRLGNFLMRLASSVALLGQEIKPTLDKNAPDYTTRLSGLEQMSTGLLQMFSGAASMVAERQTYSVAERKRFAAMLTEVFPTIALVFTGEGREALQSRLRHVGQEDPDPTIKAALTKIGAKP